MPIICVNPDKIGSQDKFEYLANIAPEGIVVGKTATSYYAMDPNDTKPPAYIFDDWTQINFWGDAVPAWLIELATNMERKTLSTIKINLILGT